MIYLISLGAFVATVLGGLFALRLRDRLHLILGFSAGAVIGVAFLDLIPEAFELMGATHDPFFIGSIIALGFVLYMFADRMFTLHTHDHEEHSHEIKRGVLGAGSLSIHSFLDGVGIGLAFKVSPEIGLVVAIAVLAHDFSDGINTVNMIIKSTGDRRRALRWLLIDALAPVLGVLATLFFTVSESQLGLLLALFSGMFLYIGASELLPESHHAHPVRWTTVATALGVLAMYVIILLAGI
jgi:ZIP family zinc transporter